VSEEVAPCAADHFPRLHAVHWTPEP
jgi:hypothetical protein